MYHVTEQNSRLFKKETEAYKNSDLLHNLQDDNTKPETNANQNLFSRKTKPLQHYVKVMVHYGDVY